MNDENLDYENKQNNDTSKQLNDDVKEEVVKEKLDLALD